MQFKPKTEKECKAGAMLPAGTYPIRCLEAAEKTDKNGDPFFNIKLAVHVGETIWTQFDNLSNEWMAHKLRHFCHASGIGKQYDSGNLSARDLLQAECYVEIHHKRDKQSGEMRAEVKDYSDAAKPSQVDNSDDVEF